MFGFTSTCRSGNATACLVRDTALRHPDAAGSSPAIAQSVSEVAVARASLFYVFFFLVGLEVGDT